MTDDQDKTQSPAQRKARSRWNRPDHVLRQTEGHLEFQRIVRTACSAPDSGRGPSASFDK
jgi:hypothetical protein